MKYDVLNPFQDYLKQNLNVNTAKKYYSCVVRLFKDKQFNDISEVNREFLEGETLKFKTRNEFSAVKNALKHLKKFYPDLDIPDESFFKENSLKKRNWSKKPKKNIYLDQTRRKINQISDKKLKYAYRLALVSGLRVSELAALEAKDITFNQDKIIVNVRHGKGGSNGIIECLSDKYLYENLKEYVSKFKPDDKIFYSNEYMKHQAMNLKMECHDFRRIFAITCRNQLKKEMPVDQANQLVQEKLRHKRFSTTKRYLFNRKLVFVKKVN